MLSPLEAVSFPPPFISINRAIAESLTGPEIPQTGPRARITRPFASSLTEVFALVATTVTDSIFTCKINAAEHPLANHLLKSALPLANMTIAQEINFGYSPSSSADFDDALNPLSFDDDFQHEHDQLGLDDDEDDVKAYDQPSGAQANGKPKRANNRKGPGNADKRATHNAVERARRESLNGRFSVSLTRALESAGSHFR